MWYASYVPSCCNSNNNVHLEGSQTPHLELVGILANFSSLSQAHMKKRRWEIVRAHPSHWSRPPLQECAEAFLEVRKSCEAVLTNPEHRKWMRPVIKAQ
jgi:hypothetical protein